MLLEIAPFRPVVGHEWYLETADLVLNQIMQEESALQNDETIASLTKPDEYDYIGVAGYGQLLGIAATEANDYPIIDLRYLAIIPAAQGGKLGSYLLRHVIETARQDGMYGIHTMPVNQTEGFYRRHGFTNQVTAGGYYYKDLKREKPSIVKEEVDIRGGYL